MFNLYGICMNKKVKKYIQKIYKRLNSLYCRMRIRNDNFSIITNTCIGGVMYHKLGKRFMSPTINLWMHDEDFLRFVHDLDYYLSCPLWFVKGIADYPTAYCGDVLIFFLHYSSEEEAAAKWYERCERVNKENLFIICSDRPYKRSITHEDMIGLKEIPCRGRVVFSTRMYDDIDYIVPLSKDTNGDYVALYMDDRSELLGRWRWETAWDWVHWLNTGEIRK